MRQHWWTEEQDKDILENYKWKYRMQFAEKYGLKPSTVASRYKCLKNGTARRRLNYSPEQIRTFLIENWNNMDMDQLRESLGITKGSIYVRVCRLRKEGHDLRLKCDERGRGASPIGSMNRKCRLVKAEDGKWKYLRVEVDKRFKAEVDKRQPYVKKIRQPKPEKIKRARIRKEKPVKAPKVRVGKVKVEKPKPIALPKRLPKKEVVQLPTKVRDYSGMRLVKIDSKTWKYIKAS